MGKLSRLLHRFFISAGGWSPLKKICVNCSVAAAAVILTFAAGELALRLYHAAKYSDARVSESSIMLDNEIGWIPNPSYTFHGERLDAHGKKYHADVFQENRDFRVFGDTSRAKTRRVLFLGDSFTHAVEVSNDSTFYSIFARSLDVEVFTLGTGGYSTLQECMLLKKHVGKIEPDVVILQFCYNDFISNHYQLELRSVINNNGLRRPYMSAAGDIFFAIPKKHSLIRDMAINHSRLLYFILSRLDMLEAGGESIEDEIREKGLKIAAFRESVDITGKLVRSIKDCLPAGTALYAFCVYQEEPFFSQMKKLFRENDVPFIEGVSEELVRARHEGLDISADDCRHFNRMGHRLVAGELEKFFRARI